MKERNTNTSAGDQLFRLLVCVALWCGKGEAQTGAIRGHVTDPQGAIVAQAKVKLMNSAGSKVADTHSGADGSFQFSTVRCWTPIRDVPVRRSRFPACRLKPPPAALRLRSTLRWA